jgi:hypothetical protein
MRGLWKCALCYLLAALMVLDPNLIQQWLARAQQPAGKKEAPAKPTPEDLKRIADEMERGFKALEAAEKEIPRDTFDPKAIVDKVGKDPVKLFEWVRDNTYWVPYQGALRGPIGVLMDRLGSSCDRSLLLAELLRVAGHKVRLARGELTEAQAKELLPKIRAVPKEPLPRPKAAAKNETDAMIERYAKEYKLDGPALRKNMDKSSLQGAKLAEDVAQRVTDQTPLILKAVGAPDENTVKAQREREAAAQLAALREHWWVQREEAAGWSHLDPLLPDAQAGSGQTTTKESFEPDGKTNTIALDGKFCHEFKISVVIEQWTKGGLKEKTVLSHTLRPSELFGEHIALRHVPVNWPKELDLFKEKEPLEKLKTTVLAESEWLPVLTVGSKSIADSSFTDAGDVNKGALNQLASSLGKGVKGLDPFGRFPKPGAKSKTQARLIAEWIEYEVHTPGQPVQRIRRQIFDSLGPADRLHKKTGEDTLTEAARLDRGLILIGKTEILPQVCQVSPEFVSRVLTKNLLVNRDLLFAFSGPRERGSEKRLNDLAQKIQPVPMQLYGLAMARSQWSRVRNDVFLDQVNILSHHAYGRQDSKKRLLYCEGFDIVTNGVAVRAASAANPFQIRLSQGVADTNAEAVLMSGCAKVENTAAIFATGSGERARWLTIRNSQSAAWQKMPLPKDVRARIEQDLESGYVVMVPEQPVPVEDRSVTGWWRIDPKNGQVLGIGERGWGQTTS